MQQFPVRNTNLTVYKHTSVDGATARTSFSGYINKRTTVDGANHQQLSSTLFCPLDGNLSVVHGGDAAMAPPSISVALESILVPAESILVAPESILVPPGSILVPPESIPVGSSVSAETLHLEGMLVWVPKAMWRVNLLRAHSPPEPGE